VAKSTALYILKRKESTGELRNNITPGKPRKITLGQQISKEKPLTAAIQVSILEVDE